MTTPDTNIDDATVHDAIRTIFATTDQRNNSPRRGFHAVMLAHYIHGTPASTPLETTPTIPKELNDLSKDKLQELVIEHGTVESDKYGMPFIVGPKPSS